MRIYPLPEDETSDLMDYNESTFGALAERADSENEDELLDTYFFNNENE